MFKYIKQDEIKGRVGNQSWLATNIRFQLPYLCSAGIQRRARTNKDGTTVTIRISKRDEKWCALNTQYEKLDRAVKTPFGSQAAETLINQIRFYSQKNTTPFHTCTAERIFVNQFKF